MNDGRNVVAILVYFAYRDAGVGGVGIYEGSDS